jgi:glutaminase
LNCDAYFSCDMGIAHNLKDRKIGRAEKMKQPTKDYLEEVIKKCRPYSSQGKVADYIPELKKANPQALGITIATCEGEIVSVGDCDTFFTLQSISKVISLILALEDCGEEVVFQKVGMEPTGDPFNSIIHLETLHDNKPFNPMINAGAIAVASLIKGKNVEERFQRILSLLQKMTSNPKLTLNEQVYESEKKTGDRNRSLAYFMKSTGTIETDVEEALDLYFRFNSINIQCSDLAKIGCFFANQGRLSNNKEELVSATHVRIVKTIMFTSGMYNASGEFAIHVGFPAKSGVSGGILASVPGKMGIGVIGPAINEKGNSVAGVQVLRSLSEDLSLSMMNVNDLNFKQ